MPVRAEKHRARTSPPWVAGSRRLRLSPLPGCGGRALLATRLGDDMVGDEIVRALEADGVDCSPTIRHKGIRSSLSAALVDRAGERMVINYGDPALPDDASHLPSRLPAACVP